ncbi:MAG: hypothetical protein PHY73_05755 [Candidatus Omnitrophica bacterium]|nr:hypothetical protein [Candidatus Omnitrophota bacterium]
MEYFKAKKLSEKLGLTFATIHFSFIFYIAYSILVGSEPDWAMYWLLPFLVDLPFSLIGYFLMPAICSLISLFSSITTSFPYPMSDISNYLGFFFFFAIFGTLWHLFLPVIIANLLKLGKKTPILILAAYLFCTPYAIICFFSITMGIHLISAIK